MTDIILVGSGGCMRELVWQILESNRISDDWNIIGYVDENMVGKNEGITVAGLQIPYLGDDDFLLKKDEDIHVVLSVGSPLLRKKLAEKYKENSHIKFPNIILRNASVCDDLKTGMGCIVSMGAKISTNVTMGDFVFINMDGMVCHDGRLADYVSINPSAKLAGAVTVGENTEIGMGANVIQGVHVGCDVVVGAGCVIIEDTGDACTMVGVPGRRVRG